MTADRFDRFDRVFADALIDLAQPEFPDYFDDVLATAVRPAQRPAWTFPERWLPMSAITRRLVLVPEVPWRTVGLLALLALLLATAFVVVGSQRRGAPPFGPARNGLLVYSAAGDLFTLDPTTRATAPLVTGPSEDLGPVYSRDGTRLAFVRLEGRNREVLMVANADGTDVRALTPVQDRMDWWDWSPDGRTIAFTSRIDELPTIHVVPTDGSAAPKALDVGMAAEMPNWRPPDGAELIFRGHTGRASGIFAIRPDGTNLRPLTPTDGNLQFGYMGRYGLSSDGKLLTYTVWEDQSDLRIHVLDLVTGEDSTRVGPKEEADAIFSPDDKLIAFNGRDDSLANGQVGIFVGPVDDPDRAVQVGPPSRADNTGNPGLTFEFSPDGSQLIVTNTRDFTVWVAPVTGGEGEAVVGGVEFASWQRLAP